MNLIEESQRYDVIAEAMNFAFSKKPRDARVSDARWLLNDIVTLRTNEVVKELIPDASWETRWGIGRAMQIGFEVAQKLAKAEL